MARKLRIKLSGIKSFYHVFSRTVAKEFLLNDSEKKEYFMNILDRLSLFFTIKVKAFVVMSNHFHMVLETCPEREKDLSNEEITKRAKKANLYKSLILKNDIEKLRKKMNDISEFVKLLKQIFAQWYNKKYNRTGHFWGERFKSILIQKGIYLLRCITYVILNPVRARLVDSPEKYKFSSFYKPHKKYENIIKNILGNPMLKKYHMKIERFFNCNIMGKNDFIEKVKSLSKQQV